jgi:flagellar protein FlgJ
MNALPIAPIFVAEQAIADKPAAKAAEDFEALLIGQMLRHARENGSGWLGDGENASGDGLVEFAEQNLAKAIAAAGGLGLVKGLNLPAMLQTPRAE